MDIHSIKPHLICENKKIILKRLDIAKKIIIAQDRIGTNAFITNLEYGTRVLDVNVYDFFDFTEKAKKENRGVYLLGDFYVGRSGDIFKRCYGHLNDLYQFLHRGKRNNFKKDMKVLSHIVRGKKIKVDLLSKSGNKEKKFIEKLGKKLTNITHNPYNNG